MNPSDRKKRLQLKNINLVMTSVKVMPKPLCLCQHHHKNKIFQWNSMLEVCEDKTTCHTKLFIWTKKWQLAPSEKKAPWCWLLSKWCQKHTVTAKTTTENMIFQWKSMSSSFWGKATHHLWVFVSIQKCLQWD